MREARAEEREKEGRREGQTGVKKKEIPYIV